MYKVLIADDESIAIEALQFIIEKEFPGQCNIATAQNGRTLVEKAEELHPEIIFVDIQMPGINGIHAMREIRRTNPDVIFIVVSAFSQFDYAQKAIELGAQTYIMKPADKGRIVKELTRAMQKIDESREKRQSELQTQEKLEFVVPVVETSLVNEMLIKEKPTEEFSNYIRLLGIQEEFGNMMIIRFNEIDETGRPASALGASLRLAEQSEEIRNQIRGFFRCIPGAVTGNMIAAFIPCEEMNEDEAYAYRLEQIDQARELSRDLQKAYNYSVRVALGGVKPILQIFESSREALRIFSRVAEARVGHADEFQLLEEYDDFPIDMEQPLFRAVEDGDVTTSLAVADHFYNWMEKNYSDSIMNLRLKALEFVMRVETIGYRATGGSYRLLSRSGYMDEVLQCDDTQELRLWFRTKITETCEAITIRAAEGSQDLVDQAQEYIRNNYSRNISLEELSRRAQVSPYYFSKLFKRRAGMNFVEYLTEVRMERAKELLRDTDRRMKEVSVDVGYLDQNYFSRIFRKQFGVSPSEYRENISQK